jgi:hypothetical protein
MAKREGEVRRSSETKGSHEGVGSHFIFFNVCVVVCVCILKEGSSRKEVKIRDCMKHFQILFPRD